MGWLIGGRRRADARRWPGRRALALVDALAWPMAWMATVLHVPSSRDVVAAFVVAACAFVAMRRVRRALCQNERYFFTAWRWGRFALWLVLLGLVLRLVVVR